MPLVIARRASPAAGPAVRIQVNNRKVSEGFYRGLGLDRRRRRRCARRQAGQDRPGQGRRRCWSRRPAPTDDAGRRRAWRWPRSPRRTRRFVDAVRGARRRATRCWTRASTSWPRWCATAAEHAPGLLRGRPEDRPRARLLHRHRLRDPAASGYERAARSAPAAGTTTWPPTARTRYPGVGISIGVSRLLGLLFGAGRCCGVPLDVPTCVLVALTAEEERARRDRIAAALRARGIAGRGGAEPRRSSASRSGTPSGAASRTSGSPAPRRAGDEVKDIRSGEQVDADPATWEPPAADRRPARRRPGGGRRDGAGDRGGHSDRRGLSLRWSQPAVVQLERRQRSNDLRFLRPPRAGGVVVDPREPSSAGGPAPAAQRGRGRVARVDEPLRGGRPPHEPHPQQQPETSHDDDRDERRDQPEHSASGPPRGQAGAGVPDRARSGRALEGALQVLADQRDLSRVLPASCMVEPKLLPAPPGGSQDRAAEDRVVDHAPAVRPSPTQTAPGHRRRSGGAAAGRVGIQLHRPGPLAPGLPGRDPGEDRVTAPPSWRRSTGAATGPYRQMDQLEEGLDSREGRHPSRGQEPRVPRGHHPRRRARAGPPRPRGLRRDRTPASARRSPTRTSSRPGATILRHRRRRLGRPATWSSRSRSRSPRSTTGCARARCSSPTCTWPPSKRVHRRAARPQGHRHRLRDRRAAGPLAAAAGADVRGRRPARPAGRRVPPDARRGRPRRPDGRRLRRLRRQGRRHRRRRLRHERRRDRARHAGRGAAARPEHRPAARRPTGSTRATCRRSPPTPTRSSGPCLDADLVIGAVLVPGAKAPTLVTNELVVADEARARCSSTSPSTRAAASRTRGPTTHADPTYQVHDSVFYCVANMPGAVPHTSTYALTNVTLPYAVELANRGWRDALRARPGAGARA